MSSSGTSKETTEQGKLREYFKKQASIWKTTLN